MVNSLWVLIKVTSAHFCIVWIRVWNRVEPIWWSVTNFKVNLLTWISWNDQNKLFWIAFDTPAVRNDFGNHSAYLNPFSTKIWHSYLDDSVKLIKAIIRKSKWWSLSLSDQILKLNTWQCDQTIRSKLPKFTIQSPKNLNKWQKSPKISRNGILK